MNLTPVTSSTIEAIGHNPETQTLHIKFKPYKGQSEGPTYAYNGFTPAEFERFKAAPSTGKHFHANIKPHYKGIKL